MAKKEKDENVRLVQDRYQAGLKAIRRQMQEYWLNFAFLKGHQWLYYNNYTNRLDQIPREEDRVQATINLLAPNTRTIMSSLMQRELTFEVPPTAAGDSYIRGARLGEALVAQQHRNHNWESKREASLYAAWKGGTAAISVEWDPDAGDPAGEGVKPGDSPIREGDTREEVLSIAEFVVEPGVRDAERARWWIKAVAYPPEEVKNRFSLKETPEADATSGLTPFMHKMVSLEGGSTQDMVELTRVLTYYERPNNEAPKGRVLQVVGNEVVFKGEWPFSFESHLNFALIRETVDEQHWAGDTILSQARTVQVAYNAAWSNKLEHLKLAGSARLMVGRHSVELIDDLTDLPGEVLVWDGQGSPPQYLSPPNLPNWVQMTPAEIKENLDDIMGVHAISRGAAPANIESGFGLSILAEQDGTPTTRLNRETAAAWSRVASMNLALIEQEAGDTQREVKVKQQGNAAMSIAWTGKDLRGQTDVVVSPDSILPRSRAGLVKFASDLVQMGMIEDINQFAAVAELPGQQDMLEALSHDVARARRENARLVAGRQTEPKDYDDHQIHINEHNKFRKTEDYELMSEEDREAVDDHIEAHTTLIAEELGRQRQAQAIDPALSELTGGSTEAPLLGPETIPENAPPPAASPALPPEAGIAPAPGAVPPEQAADDVVNVLNQLGNF